MKEAEVDTSENSNSNVEKEAVARTQKQLIWRQFKRHKLAVFGLYVLMILVL